MKTIKGSGFSYHLGDEFAIFEPDSNIDDLSREFLKVSIEALTQEYDHPFAIIFPRSNRVAIDLLAARSLLEKLLPNLVAIANVTADPTTALSVEYEKTIVDLMPIETFPDMNGAINWATEIVREQRNGE